MKLSSLFWVLLGHLIVVTLAIIYNPSYLSIFDITPLFDDTDRCPSAEFVDTFDHEMTQFLLHDKEFRNKALQRFSRAIQVDTMVDESMTDFSKMLNFHKYLKREFPRVFERAEVTTVNGYGLLFEFKGKTENLKPVLFMAHQDTVPLGELSDWVVDPLAGYYDEEKIYGRGTNDVKGLLVGLMGAMDAILTQNPHHTFERTILFGFGYDEELGGNLGAKHIGQYLLKKYGKDSIDHILDEGAPMCLEANGNYLGLIVTAEKGYRDLVIEVNTPGGHSSNPRDTTAIGILSKILANYEKEKFVAKIPDESPILNLVECAVKRGSFSRIISFIGKLTRSNPIARYLLVKALAKNSMLEYTIRTSQAIDVINGGDKFNSLPRNVTAVINHRITIGDNFKTITDKAIRAAKPEVLNSKIGLVVDDKEIIAPTELGVVKIYSIKGADMPVAPITPVYDEIWFRLAGYMRTFYEKEVYPDIFSTKPYIIAPASMQGNTDTKHYWKLTNHIFRVQPGITNLFKAGMHGTNEYCHIDTHMQVIAFYYNYILGIC